MFKNHFKVFHNALNQFPITQWVTNRWSGSCWGGLTGLFLGQAHHGGTAWGMGSGARSSSPVPYNNCHITIYLIFSLFLMSLLLMSQSGPFHSTCSNCLSLLQLISISVIPLLSQNPEDSCFQPHGWRVVCTSIYTLNWTTGTNRAPAVCWALDYVPGIQRWCKYNPGSLRVDGWWLHWKWCGPGRTRCCGDRNEASNQAGKCTWSKDSFLMLPHPRRDGGGGGRSRGKIESFKEAPVPDQKALWSWACAQEKRQRLWRGRRESPADFTENAKCLDFWA